MGFGQLAASRYLLPATGASHQPAVDFHEVSIHISKRLLSFHPFSHFWRFILSEALNDLPIPSQSPYLMLSSTSDHSSILCPSSSLFISALDLSLLDHLIRGENPFNIPSQVALIYGG